LVAYLVLEDGSVFTGEAFGASSTVGGEVVFNTGMVGYTEAVTDPSYKGQILCQTYPLIGNYGVSKSDFESNAVQIEGYILHELCRSPSHSTSENDLDSMLKEHGIPGISNIDTRTLTKKLRIKGVMLGLLSTDEDLEDLKHKAKNIQDPNSLDLVKKVTVNETVYYAGENQTVVVIDCGVKMNIIRNLISRDLNVIRVPADYSADKIMQLNPQGIVISNGPGDPKKADYVIETTKQLIEYKIPIFGICLGHQILALALGGDTYKLRFGHRGQNHPCIDLRTKKCFVTSQNHGYAIDANSVQNMEVTFLNINDKTVEGIKHKNLPVYGFQWHPEASPGPTDTSFLFDEFSEDIKKYGDL